MTNAYKAAQAESTKHKEDNDCAVIAVSIVTGLSYRKVLEAFIKAGRQPRSRTHVTITMLVLQSLGFKIEEVHLKSMIALIEPPCARRSLRNVTTYHPRRFPDVWSDGRYLLFVPQHLTACVDGEVHDWTHNKKKKVIRIWKITKKTSRK